TRLCADWPRVAFGSSGEFATVGSDRWWERIGAALNHVCDAEGSPRVKLHGLRMLDPSIFGRIPFASADSANVAINFNGKRWIGPYSPKSPDIRALVLADRIESAPTAALWGKSN